MFWDDFSFVADWFGPSADAASAAAPAAATAASTAADSASLLGTLGSAGSTTLDFLGGASGALGALNNAGQLGQLGLNIYGAVNQPSTTLPPAQMPNFGAPLAGPTRPRGLPTPDMQAAGLSGASPDFFALMNQDPQAYNPYGYSFQPGGQAPAMSA
jgi:hypothetical protein